MRNRVRTAIACLIAVVTMGSISGCCWWCRSKCVGTCCLPDLTVTAATFNAAARTVSVSVKNVGSAHAGEFLVYVEINQLGAPDSAKPESQYVIRVPGLLRGAQIDYPDIPMTAFSARPSINLSTLTHGELLVDANAKMMVKECDYDNNDRRTVF